MRAFVITGPQRGVVQDVPDPDAAAGQVVVEVERAGVCGTDSELFSGEMAYLHEGSARYPLRPGHEWCGTVREVAADVDRSWLGRRVTGDTMLGCGHCARCRAGRHHVCADRFEIGIRGGFPGALAERLAVPASALLPLPDAVDGPAGAMVEPGGNAVRCVRAAEVGRGDPLLVLGTGTIGLLVAAFGRAAGAEVHLLAVDDDAVARARTLGEASVSTRAALPDRPWRAVVDATNADTMPALAVDLVEPGGRVVYIGIAETASTIDTRDLVFRDITAVGVLAASAGLAGAAEAYAAGTVDPRPLVGATIGLDGVADVLAGRRPPGAGAGPKIHVDPRP
ncbi:zinc-dependent alcohol dehydrogenase [Jatrophihabitans sp. YIM 134969]